MPSPFTDVEVVRWRLDARPPSSLHGAAADLAAAAGVVRWHLSLTHTDQVAMAVVIAERSAPRRTAAEARRLASR